MRHLKKYILPIKESKGFYVNFIKNVCPNATSTLGHTTIKTYIIKIYDLAMVHIL